MIQLLKFLNKDSFLVNRCTICGSTRHVAPRYWLIFFLSEKEKKIIIKKSKNIFSNNSKWGALKWKKILLDDGPF